MKKIAFLTLCLVLTAALLTGCGCTNQKKDNAVTSVPTVLPTNEEVWKNTTAPTSRPTTPSTAATEPSAPTETIDRGNGPLEDTGSGTNNGSSGSSTDNTGSSTSTDNSSMSRSRGMLSSGR